MEKRTYLTGGLQETTNAAGRVTQSLLSSIEREHLVRWTKLLSAIVYCKNADGVPVEDVENLVLGAYAFQLAAMASAMGTVHGKAFDPVDFGKFAEQIAREFAPQFELMGAERDAETATKN